MTTITHGCGLKGESSLVNKQFAKYSTKSLIYVKLLRRSILCPGTEVSDLTKCREKGQRFGEKVVMRVHRAEMWFREIRRQEIR